MRLHFLFFRTQEKEPLQTKVPTLGLSKMEKVLKFPYFWTFSHFLGHPDSKKSIQPDQTMPYGASKTFCLMPKLISCAAFFDSAQLLV